MARSLSTRFRRGLTVLLAALCLSLCAGALSVNAAWAEAAPSPTPPPPEETALPEETAPPEETPLPEETAPPEAEPDKPGEEALYPDVRVYWNGLLTGRGYLVEDENSLSPEEICALYDVDLTVDLEAGAVSSPQGLEMQMPEGEEYMTANSRYLYTPHGPVTVDGRLYLPADAIRRVFGLQIQLGEEPLRADISGDAITFLQGGEFYYDNAFTEELFWLAHIIQAEAGGEPLAGMIGVGNVVMNRVEDDHFPDNVFDVIYEHDTAVQFSPITSERFLYNPTPRSYIATYLVLEGYNTVGKSMFFVNPDIGDDSWFKAALRPVTVIGHHHFYAVNSPEELDELEEAEPHA